MKMVKFNPTFANNTSAVTLEQLISDIENERIYNHLGPCAGA